MGHGRLSRIPQSRIDVFQTHARLSNVHQLSKLNSMSKGLGLQVLSVRIRQGWVNFSRNRNGMRGLVRLLPGQPPHVNRISKAAPMRAGVVVLHPARGSHCVSSHEPTPLDIFDSIFSPGSADLAEREKAFVCRVFSVRCLSRPPYRYPYRYQQYCTPSFRKRKQHRNETKPVSSPSLPDKTPAPETPP